MTRRTVGSVAIVNPLGDFGITTYAFELAEGLAANGVRVDFYTGNESPLSELPAEHRHRCFPVLGSVLFKQRRTLASPSRPGERSSAPDRERLPSVAPAPGSPGPPAKPWKATMRRAFLGAELAVYLRRRNYDLVWTQWPDVYGAGFWRRCRALGMPLAHTVHNALPHEDSGAQVPLLRRVYAPCDLLFIHSEQARRDFVESFPEFGNKLAVTPHGLYTVYPRSTEARGRVREKLGLSTNGLVALICGGIRPYKNVDAVLAALADPRCARITLVVAGEESGYDGASATDPLSRTRRLAGELGVTDRVRFIPRFLRAIELAELLEAVDVLALPYTRSYGSGLLLLGMTFGKHILTTATGGAEEYLADYSAHTLLRGEGAAAVAAGLLQAGGSIAAPAAVPPPRAARLEWPAIARIALDALREAL